MAPGTAGSKNNVLPLWGNDKTMNLNNLILTNIQSSHYFKVNLFELKTYHEVIDEIYYKVAHLEPWEKGSRKTSGQTGMCGGVRGVGAGGIVSTAYCLLYKLFTLKLTRKQVNGLITHSDSPYIRALGFMYIRYSQPPADLWDWFEEYLEDDEEVDVKAGGGCTMTMGEMLRHFLSKLEWYSTLFPRIPVPIQKDIEMKLAPYGPIVRAGGPGACPAIGRPGEEEIPFAGSFREGEHIPDDEVSYGEAERVARLRRSSSRERRSRRDENKNGDVDEYGREKQGRDSREKDHKSSRGSSHHRHKRHHSRDRKRKPRSRSPGTGRSHSADKKARRRSRSGSHGHHHRSSHSRSREH